MKNHCKEQQEIFSLISYTEAKSIYFWESGVKLLAFGLRKAAILRDIVIRTVCFSITSNKFVSGTEA